MTTTQRGILPWVFPIIAVNVVARGALGANACKIESPAAVNLVATINYAYTPASADAPAEAAIRSVNLVNQTLLHGGAGLHVVLDAGYDIASILPEIEIERLQEMIVERNQPKRSA